METVQNESVQNTKSSSEVSCIKKTNPDELSKEKDQLIFDAEEDGEDEDALSDDSMRLRLSDDEDAEQEDTAKNHKNISELKSPNINPEQPSKDMIIEEKSSSDLQQVVEEAVKSNSEKLTSKEPESAINDLPENSTLTSDECISENKSTQNNVHNLENSTVVTNMSDENCTLNVRIKVENDCLDENISESTDITKNEMQLNYTNDDENTVDIKILDNIKREDSVIKCTFDSAQKKDTEVTEESNVCKKEPSEEDILENDHLSPAEKLTETSSCQNAELTSDSEHKPEVTEIKCDEIDITDTCVSENLDTADDYDNLINSATIKISNDEKLSTITFSDDDKCDDNLTILNDNAVKIVFPQNPPVTEINDDNDSTDANRFCTSDDGSSFSKHFDKSNTKNSELEDTTQNTNTSKAQSIQQEKSISLIESDSSDVIDTTEVTNDDCDINKSTGEAITDVPDNNSASKKRTSVALVNTKDNENESDNDTVVLKRKRLKTAGKFISNAAQDCIIEEDKQDKQEVRASGRQKRRTAKNAEEIIRRKYLNSDSDYSDSDSEQFTLSSGYKSNQNVSSAPSASLKRNCSDKDESTLPNGTAKKVKKMSNNLPEQTSVANDVTKLAFVEKLCQKNIKEKLTKFTQEQLEELLIQKIVETMTMRSEIGLLREQARVSERNQELTRMKLQQLAKQVKDFEMVLNRNAADRRTNPEKVVTPIKINRSVGLQVNFMTEHGMQNLRQIQQTSQKNGNATSNVSTAPAPEPVATGNNVNSSPKRGIKIRSPRRSEASMAPSNPAISQNSMHSSPLISTVTPAALVVAKPLDTQQTLTLPNQTNAIQQIQITGNMSQQQQQIQPQAYVVNGKIQNQVNRSLIKPKGNDLIDLTDEEEKSKSAAKVTVTSAPTLIEQQLSTAITSKPVQCFPRVIQTIPTNVAIAQPASIRVVQPNQPAPTATIVVNNSPHQNNGAPPRVAYVMQSGVGTARQLLITSNASQIRPITTCRVTTPFPAVAYKTGTSTIANGTVRVLTTPAVSNIQINKHPAPLPETVNHPYNPNWKLPPPAPSLKMSKVPNGIVLSWNMHLTDKYADIVSYQLYAYQEVAGVSPSPSLWKKVGDVRALPLPMACTLTQFSEGNNYYFAVRAVDTHSRKGQYSTPGNISL